MSYMELLNDEVIKQWLDEACVKPKTVKNYLMGFQKFLDFTGMTPEQLLEEAEDEAARNVKLRNRSVIRHRREFRTHLAKGNKDGKPYAPHSIENFMNSVASFYECMYVDVPKQRGRKGRKSAESLPENTLPLTKKDIQDVLNVCDPLERAVVLLGVASGLSLADLTDLRVCDFKRGYDPETGITTLMRWDHSPETGIPPTPLIRKKTGVEFITFLTPEASQAVWNYLDFRKRKPGTKDNPVRRRQLQKQWVSRDEGYLFILKNVSDKYLDIKKCESNEEWLKRYEEIVANETYEEWQRREDMRKYHENAFTHLYARLCEKCQKCNPKGWNQVRSHNARKYFSSTLKNAKIPGVDNFFVEYIMGHKIVEAQKPYFFGNPVLLKEKYKDCIPFLTIQKELDISASKEYQKLLEENKTMLLETERHIVERQELQDIRAELEATKAREAEKVDRNEFLALQRKLAQMQAKVEACMIEEHIREEDEKTRQTFREWDASRSEEDRMCEAASKHAEEEHLKNIEAYWEQQGEDKRMESAIEDHVAEEEKLMVEAVEKHIQEEKRMRRSKAVTPL